MNPSSKCFIGCTVGRKYFVQTTFITENLDVDSKIKNLEGYRIFFKSTRSCRKK